MPTSTRLALYTAFGWSVVRMAMPAGAEHLVLVRKDTARADLPAAALWTKGRVTGFNHTGGFAIADRLKGTMTGESGLARRGRIVLTAVEDSEWWCVPASLNGGRMPGLTALRVPAGQSALLPAGTKLLLCDGDMSVDGGAVAVGESLVTGAATASSVSGALGLIFSDAAS